MPPLHTPGKLALILIATVAGCYEGGALDPLSPATATPPASNYRELSLLGHNFSNKNVGCKDSKTTTNINISSPSTPNNTCVISFSSFAFPDYNTPPRIHVGVSSTEPTVSFSVNVMVSLNNMQLTNYSITKDLKKVDYSILIPSTALPKPQDDSVLVMSFGFVSTMQIDITRLGIELDAPQPTPGSI